MGGSGVARGYLKRRELTAEKFIPNPFQPGQKLYRSGDLGMQLEDGSIRYMGRLDEQVKVRGFRIELGEIERTLGKHQAVRDVHVEVQADEAGDKEIKAYLTLNKEAALIHAQFKFSSLADQLMYLPNDLPVYQINRNETTFLHQEIFEDDAYARHVDIKPGDTILDVGANIGMFTLSIALRYPGSQVLAFEPIPDIYEALEANASLYGHLANIKVFNMGLSDAKGETTFTYYPGNTVMSGAHGSDQDLEVVTQYLENQYEQDLLQDNQLSELVNESMQSKSFNCQLDTVSAIIAEQGLETIDLLKIDVEKSEWQVIQGIEDKDWARIKQLIIEVHDQDGLLKKIENLLTQHGFEVTTEQDDVLENTKLYMVYARQKEAGATITQPKATSIAQMRWTQANELIRDIRSYAASQLPHYMVPSEVLLVEAFPVTHNGKLNRSKLRTVPAFGISNAVEQDIVLTATEEKLVEIWKELLGKTQISPEDNFFEIGGHSLKATQLVSRINKDMGHDIGLKVIFGSPTLSDLAAALDELGADEAANNIAPAPKAQDYPLSAAQKAMWILDQYKEDQVAYIIPGTYELTGQPNVEAFSQAFYQVVAKYESLRTVFYSKNGEPRQRIVPVEDCGFALEVIDVEKEENPASKADELTLEEVKIPFSLEKGPLLRVKLIKLSANQYRLLFACHHIISDGWSIDIIITEVIDRYTRISQGLEVDSPSPPLQYKDCVVWQHEQMTSEKRKSHQQYWAAQLEGHMPLDMQTDLPRPILRTFAGDYINIALEPSELLTLVELAKENEGSLYMVLMASMYTLFYVECGQEDITLGSPIAGRYHHDLEEQVGLFINSLPLRAQFKSEDSFATLCQKVKQVSQAAFDRQDYPFDYLLEDLAIERDLSRTPLFDVWVVLQNKRDQDVEDLAGLQVKELNPDYRKSQFDLLFDFKETETGLHLHLEYNTDLYTTARMERLLENWRSIIKQVIVRPDTLLEALAKALKPAAGDGANAEYLRLLGTDISEDF